MTTISTPSLERNELCSIRKKDGSDLKLSLQQVVVSGTLLPVGARLKIQHLFRSAESRPAEVIYAFMLPRDGAMKGFHVRGETFEIHSELRETKQAETIYEDALEKGHLATLAREYQDGVVNICLGNLRPQETVIVTLDLLAGTELHDDGFRFRFPFTLPLAYHAQAVVSSDDFGDLHLDLPPEFGDMILPSWTNNPDRLHRIGLNLKLLTPGSSVSLSSPSHTIRMEPNADGYTVKLADVEQIPDHDLVLDVRFDQPRRMGFSGKGRDGLRHFIFTVPSSELGLPVKQGRRVTFVVDHSGSMAGKPLETAKELIRKLLTRLSPEDEFNIVAFESAAKALWKNQSRATPESVEKANRFLKQLQATGGTELLGGLEQAVTCSNRDSDVFLITDGSVFGTEAIISKARQLGMRIHVLGICEEGQERFLDILSRGTGGVCRTILPGESTEKSCEALLSILGGCVASQLHATSTSRSLQIEPELSQAVFAGCPLVVMGECGSDEDPQITLTWSSNGVTKSLAIGEGCPTKDLGETVALLRGSRLITDCQGVGSWTGDATGHHLKALSQRFDLASREMSLVAVVKRPGDEHLEAPKTVVVPVGSRREYLDDVYARQYAVCHFMPPASFATANAINLGWVRHTARYLRDTIAWAKDRIWADSPTPDEMDEDVWFVEGDEVRWIAGAAYLLRMLHDCQGRFSRRLRRDFNDILNRLEQSPHASVDPRCQSLLSWFREQNRYNKPLSLTTEQVAMLDTISAAADADGLLTDHEKDAFWYLVSTLPGITMPSA